MGLFGHLSHHATSCADARPAAPVPAAPSQQQGHSAHVHRVTDDAPVRSGRFTVHSSRDAYGAVSTPQRASAPVPQQAAPRGGSSWGSSAPPAPPTPVVVLAPQEVHVHATPFFPAPPMSAPWAPQPRATPWGFGAPAPSAYDRFAGPSRASSQRSEAWSHSYDPFSGRTEEVYVRRTSGPRQTPCAFATPRTRDVGSTADAIGPLIRPLFNAVASVVRGVWRAIVWVVMLPVRIACALGNALLALLTGVQRLLTNPGASA